MKKRVIILIMIAMFVVTMVFGYGDYVEVGIFREENIVNDVSAVIHNERIYYSNSRGFFSMNTDGSDHQMLNDVFARNIRIVDDKIYFSNRSYRGYIYSMNIDGTNLQRLFEDGVSRIIVANGWIYYNINSHSGNNWDSGIYRIRTDGSDRQLVTDDGVYDFYHDFYVVGDIIYYSTWEGILSINVDGNNRRQVSNDIIAININVIDDHMFFTCVARQKIFSIETNGSNLRQLSNDRTRYIHIVGDRIYYSNEDNRRIYSIKTDGSDRRRLARSNEVEWITIFSGRPFIGHNVLREDIFIFIPGM